VLITLAYVISVYETTGMKGSEVFVFLMMMMMMMMMITTIMRLEVFKEIY